MEDNQNSINGLLKLVEELEQNEKLKNLSQITTTINLIESIARLQDEIKFLHNRVLYLEGLVLEKSEKE